MEETLPAPLVDGNDVLLMRGIRVMLDHRVALAFGTETKRINEAVARNPEKFDERHAFQLSDAEAAALRSQAATSKGRGGPRYAPWVFTVKGVARLATVLSTPAALRATDLIIDTFLMVHEQLRDSGSRSITVSEPGRYQASPAHREQIGKLREKLVKALDRLLDTIVDVKEQRTARQVGVSLGAEALHNIQERLRSKGLENTKLEADTNLVLAQAEKMLAEARKAQAEAEGIDLANFERRIGAVKRVADMLRDLEPDQLVGLLGDFEGDPRRLPSPRGERKG